MVSYSEIYFMFLLYGLWIYKYIQKDKEKGLPAFFYNTYLLKQNGLAKAHQTLALILADMSEKISYVKQDKVIIRHKILSQKFFT